MDRVCWIPEGTNLNGSGDGLCDYFETFRVQLQTRQVGPPCDVPTRARQTSDESTSYRIGDKPDDDGCPCDNLLGR